MCVCLSPRILITSGVIWTACDWLNKFYGLSLLYMTLAVNKMDGHGHITSMLLMHAKEDYSDVALATKGQSERWSTSFIKEENDDISTMLFHM